MIFHTGRLPLWNPRAGIETKSPDPGAWGRRGVGGGLAVDSPVARLGTGRHIFY
jgi:hypothetical protein